jgi:RimJ/RimL family protein N-acetyltransferase
MNPPMACYGPDSFTGKSGKTYSFRQCRPDDAVAFPAFYETIARETTHTMMVEGQSPEVEAVAGTWGRWQEDSFCLALGIFDGGRMVGYGLLMPSRHDDHPWTRHVARFAMMLVQEVWGEGLGRELLEVIEAEARNRGITRLEAEVRAKNGRGIRFYLNAGFKIEGTRKQAALIHGQFEDEHHLAKLFS